MAEHDNSSGFALCNCINCLHKLNVDGKHAMCSTWYFFLGAMFKKIIFLAVLRCLCLIVALYYLSPADPSGLKIQHLSQN
jgi:hypothetical protein